ncbi:MAG TPA: hypothetical protein PKA19_05020 [Bacillota bacterium]|nr:hypothetical protein [Bacillota bacterium]
MKGVEMADKNNDRMDRFEPKKAGENECPEKDKDGNCKVPGVYRDSDEIGGG